MIYLVFSMNLSFFVREHKGEKIMYELRRHPITFVPYLVLFVILAFVPVVVYFLFLSLFPNTVEPASSLYPVLVLLGSSYYLAIFLFFFGMFIDFYLDVWVVTNDRIIDVEQHGLLSRSISEIELFRIQDVTTDVHGLFPTVFHYGNVTVKTASSTTGIVFKNVRKPNGIRSALIRLSEEDRRKHFQSHAIAAQPT